MDDFDVRAKSTKLLEPSHLVEQLSHQANKYPSFPVIINGTVRTFHDVRGGYVEGGGYHLVKLVQRHDHMAPSPTEIEAAVYEIQLDDSFLLYTNDRHTFVNDEEFVLCLRVTDYE